MLLLPWIPNDLVSSMRQRIFFFPVPRMVTGFLDLRPITTGVSSLSGRDAVTEV